MASQKTTDANSMYVIYLGKAGTKAEDSIYFPEK